MSLSVVVLIATASGAIAAGKESGSWPWSKPPKSDAASTVSPFDRHDAAKKSPANSTRPTTLQPTLAQPNWLLPQGPANGQPKPIADDDSLALAQPKWMMPQPMVVVSDAPSDAPEQAATVEPPRSLPQEPIKAAKTIAAKPNRQVERPAAQTPWSSLWQGITGTNAPATQLTNNPEQTKPGPEDGLVRQFAGTNPSPTTTNTQAPMTPSTASLFPVWTQPQSESVANPPQAVKQALTVQPKPTVASAGIGSASDSTSMLWTQMGLAPETEVTQTSATSPASNSRRPSASAPNEPQESIWSGLLQPMTMTRNAPSVPRSPSESHAKTTSKSKKKKPRPESETVPDLLRPFYFTNAEPGAKGSARDPQRMALTPPISKPFDSSLARQLTLSSEEYLRAAADEPVETFVPGDPGLAAAQFVNQWSTLTNPFTITQQVALPSLAVDRSTPGGEATQVSFLQETLSAPAGTTNVDDIMLPGDEEQSEDASSERGGEDEEKEGLAGADSLGNAPQDTTLDFLRTQTVLLKPGDMQFDIGFEYTLQENNFPILLIDSTTGDVVGVDDVQFRGRELAVPMEIRYGVLNKVQTFLQVPVGWSNTQVSIDGIDIFQNDGGLGDISFGTTVQLCDATKDRPYMVGTLSSIAPTGGDPFTGIIGFSPQAPSLGNGFWSVAGNLLWIETRYDPVIVFYGFGYRYQFSHRYLGIEFQPGPEYNYTFGYGFAVNERCTLSTQFFGSYVEELKANGDRVEGTNQEPMNVQLAATFIDRCERIVEPFITFGLTDDAISSNFGITWTY